MQDINANCLNPRLQILAFAARPDSVQHHAPTRAICSWSLLMERITVINNEVPAYLFKNPTQLYCSSKQEKVGNVAANKNKVVQN